MSTIASFYIKTNKLQSVIEKLNSLNRELLISTGNFPSNLDNKFLTNEKVPDRLIVGLTQPDWVSVYYNSFNKLNEWAVQFSKEFDTLVIVTLAQSVSGSYYFCLYDKGIKKREIEYCYGEDFEPVNFGKKFEFENDLPGTKEEFDDEVEYIFDYDSIEEYCEKFGLKLEFDDLTWTIMKRKPWWKF